MNEIASGTCMVRMSISGEWITEQARNVMLSEEPTRAWRILLAAVEGNEAAAQAILDGTKKLIGDSGNDSIELVDDDPSDPDTAKYLTDLRFIYAGRLRRDKRWWRPRAMVTSFCADDMRNAPGYRRGSLGVPTFYPSPREIRRARVAHYAGPEERVYEVITDPELRCGNQIVRTDKGEYVLESGGTCGNDRCGVCGMRGISHVIFEPCSEPPHWWDPITDPKEALRDFVAHGRALEEDGCAQRHYHEPQASEVDTDAMKRDREQQRREADEAQARAEAEWDARVVAMRAAIVEQAGADTFPMDLGDGRVLTVPRAPFERWALGRAKELRHLQPAWKPVSHSGMKLNGDDTDHTDWIIGAGLEPGDAYKEPISAVSTRLMSELQKRLGKFSAGVIVDAGPVTGTVGSDVLVLPNLDPAHLPEMAKARAVITERGGKGAHLAQVALERGLTIMLVDDACTRYPAGLHVALEPSKGRIEILGRKEEPLALS